MPRIGGTTNLADAVPKTRTVTTTTPLTGGGDLTADRALAIAVGTTSGTVAAGAHTHPVADLAATGTRSSSTYLSGDGTWSVPAGSGGAGGGGQAFTITATKTAAYTMSAWDYVPVDTTGGGITLTLPTNPPAGTRVGWKLINQNTASPGTLTVTRGGTTDVFTRPGSGTTSVTAVLTGQGAIAQFDATNRVWIIQGVDLPLARLDERYAAAGSVGGGSTPDATTAAKGIVQLAGDLAGTASAPTVPGLAATEKTVNKSTAAAAVASGYIGADASGNVPAVRLPAATTTTSGILALSGDLAGTAAAPTVVKRGPAGSVPIYQPTYAGGPIPAPNLGSRMRVSACNSAFTLALPGTGGVDGQQYLCEFEMTGTTTATRTITLNAGYEIGSNVTSRTIVVNTAGAWCYVGMINRNGTWRVLAVDSGA